MDAFQVQTFPDGNRYQGEPLTNSAINGVGRLWVAGNGTKYVGDWKNSKFDGESVPMKSGAPSNLTKSVNARSPQQLATEQDYSQDYSEVASLQRDAPSRNNNPTLANPPSMA